MLALGAAGKAAAKPPVVRPPGGQNEDEFFTKCIKCSRCITACTENVIVPAQLRDGLFNLRTPVMDFRNGYCDFCKKCIDVCPTGALVSFAEETVQIGVAKLTDTCIALRTGGCTKCYEECTYEAITMSGETPVINPEACTGCGICVMVCPAHTLQSFNTESKTRGVVILTPEEAEL